MSACLSRMTGFFAGEVRAAFARWIRPDAFVEVVRGPQP
jgi:hypothetical protein